MTLVFLICKLETGHGSVNIWDDILQGEIFLDGGHFYSIIYRFFFSFFFFNKGIISYYRNNVTSSIFFPSFHKKKEIFYSQFTNRDDILQGEIFLDGGHFYSIIYR
jgi:hypothetical protein